MNATTHQLRLNNDFTTAGKWNTPRPARWMVLYDGSQAADAAVAAGMDQARSASAALFLVAADLRAEPHDRKDFSRALSDDLSTFARFGSKAGLDVDGTYLDDPTVENLLAIARSRGVTGLIVTTPFPDGLLGQFAQRSDLPRMVSLQASDRGGVV